MKSNRFILLSTLAVMILAAPAVFACGHGKGCCGSGDAKAWNQDAKFEVVNLDNGVKVTVTSTDAEAVKAIQEHVAACDGSCGSKCGKGKSCNCKDCKAGSCCGGKCCAKADMAWKKDAKFESAKLDNGMALTVTTANADAVKDLQAHFAAMGACKSANQKEGKGEAHRHGHGCAHHGNS